MTTVSEAFVNLLIGADEYVYPGILVCKEDWPDAQTYLEENGLICLKTTDGYVSGSYDPGDSYLKADDEYLQIFEYDDNVYIIINSYNHVLAAYKVYQKLAEVVDCDFGIHYHER
mgnify:CR=1 FL=1